ncbi:hypothetical protein GQ53DRAFT_747940 [Thozetella sp. PMI_491]|nr:hypothetical protein GQ53DRAFT_747940 [Thozetella sp. PMI_491]
MGSTETPAKRPWADGPYELIPRAKLGYQRGEKIQDIHDMAEEMVIIHNMLLRGINSVYLQCINVERTPADVPPFTNFARTWSAIVHHHHVAEEKWVFPEIESITEVPGLMGTNIEQHHAFENGVERYSAYLDAVKEGKEEYSGAKLRELIDAFMPTLCQHLHEEIDTLRGLDQYKDKTDWKAWSKKVQSVVVKNTQTPDGLTIDFPFAIGSHDKTFDGGALKAWPPVPGFILFVLKWIHFRKHADWWKFSPCDSNSKPRELPYAM